MKKYDVVQKRDPMNSCLEEKKNYFCCGIRKQLLRFPQSTLKNQDKMKRRKTLIARCIIMCSCNQQEEREEWTPPFMMECRVMRRRESRQHEHHQSSFW